MLNTGPFKNFRQWENVFWSSTEFQPLPGLVYTFDFRIGTQTVDTKTARLLTLVVRDGDVVSSVPEPETYALMLVGLGIVGAVVRRRKSKQI